MPATDTTPDATPDASPDTSPDARSGGADVLDTANVTDRPDPNTPDILDKSDRDVSEKSDRNVSEKSDKAPADEPVGNVTTGDIQDKNTPPGKVPGKDTTQGKVTGKNAVQADTAGQGVSTDNISDDMASGLDALESPAAATAKAASRRALAKIIPPLLAVALVLAVWQAAHMLKLSPVLPAPAAVWGELAGAWSDGTLLPALGHSLLRCLTGFGASVAIGVPLGMLLPRIRPLRAVLGPILSAVQSLPAAALVPVAVIALGPSEGAVYTVVLLGAVPSIAVGVASAIDQVPPLLMRAGTSMGATGLVGAVHVLVPAALPGFVAALRQGWTFGWRALMTAELITATPLPGVGRMLAEGNGSEQMSLVLAAVLLILVVGVLVESALFAPVDRRVLRGRGLAAGNRRS